MNKQRILSDEVFGASLWLPFLTVLFAVLSGSADVMVRQEITLNRGWNAVYVEVSPVAPLDEVFAAWPVNAVGFYDPASFLATRQFSQTWNSKGGTMSPVATWNRMFPEATKVQSIPAGTVCLAFNTNLTKTVVSITGVPAAPRMTWHITDTNEVYNFIGFSLQQGASIYPGEYLEGFDGEFLKSGFFKFSGNSENQSPVIKPVYSTATVSDGDVLLVSSDTQSDWSGVLNVSPMGGLDFGSDSSKETLSIRNDGEAARTVAVAMEIDAAYGDVMLPKTAVHIRDAAVALTNAVWTPLGGAQSSAPIATKRLSAGETWKIEFGLDRRVFDAEVQGRTFGALLRITDVDGKSKMRVDVPLVGETSGISTANRAWPGGLWVADVAFNRIVTPDKSVETETGGTAKLRLPIHIDAHGTVRLLQRVVAAGEMAADGTYAYHLFAGKATVPTTAHIAMRISAVCLPTETPVIEASGGADSLSQPDGVTFAFTVAGGGATSLLRHPLHPQHDGLQWDFKTPAPSGDVLSNYKGDVKPETFSVGNEISLSLDLNGGEAAWNPEQVKSGRITWKLTNLMRQGPVTLVGDMSFTRVSSQTEIVLE